MISSLYHEKDYMKNFCTSLGEHATNVIILKKRKSYREQKRAKSASKCDRIFAEQKEVSKS